MSAPRYHPDEERVVAREEWRGGRTSFQAKRVLAMKAARRFIIEHPGATTSEILNATGVAGEAMHALAHSGAAYFTQRPEPNMPAGKKVVQRWYPREL